MIVAGSHVITGDRAVPVVPHGAVLVRDGLVSAVGPADALRSAHPHEPVVDTRRVVLPGLVNAHTHAAMTLFRGFADDLPFATWLHERIWPAEVRLVGPELVADGTRLAIAEMLLGGITCFSDMYFYPDVAGAVAADAGMRAVLGMLALDYTRHLNFRAADHLDVDGGLTQRPEHLGGNPGRVHHAGTNNGYLSDVLVGTDSLGVNSGRNLTGNLQGLLEIIIGHGKGQMAPAPPAQILHPSEPWTSCP